MSRFLLSAALIFVLLSALVPPPVMAARRCGERMPVTLLSLYQDSDSIYVGRFEKVELGEATEDTADYTVYPITKHFTISSALKGESRKLLTLEDTEYRYKTVETTEEESEHGEEGGEDESVDLKPGDSVLLFLKANADSEQVEPTDYIDGIKKMTPDSLSSYEARIRELKGIFASEKPKHSQFVEWMIRCAADPHTRWEGVFELLQSFQNLEWQDEQAKEAKEKPEGESEESGEAEESAESEYSDADGAREFDTGDPNFAKSVTDAQKLALTNIFLERERPKKPEPGEGEAEETRGDQELIELIKRWGDSRVAASLIEQLRQDSTDASYNAELMTSIAEMLHDEDLVALANDYGNIQWESDDAEVITVTEAIPPVDTVAPA